MIIIWEIGRMENYLDKECMFLMLCIIFYKIIYSYIGEIVNDLKHGKGEEYFFEGDHYIGTYKNG